MNDILDRVVVLWRFGPFVKIRVHAGFWSGTKIVTVWRWRKFLNWNAAGLITVEDEHSRQRKQLRRKVLGSTNHGEGPTGAPT